MTTRFFRRTIICLFVVVVLMLGVVSFVIWNSKPEHERQLAHDGPGQREIGSAEEESEARPDSGSAKGTQSPRAGSPAGGKGDKGENVNSRSTEGAQAPRAASPGPGRRDKQEPRPAEGAKAYQVDLADSRVYVRVDSATRLGHRHGVEGKLKSGTISLGAGGELVFDMRSFQADTQEARKKVGLGGVKMSANEAKKVNNTMLSPDVLDVEKFPTATYKIIVIKPAERQEAGAPGAYEVSGRLTLHGAEQPLPFKAKLERTDKEGVVKLGGSFVLKQTAYGMTPYSGAGGLAKVADELEISAELVLSPGK
jgi:polyisoprenoid-binding protein YceI